MQPVYLALFGLAIALCYFPLANRAPSWPRSILKTLPLICFSGAALLSGAPAFLTAGLFLSALGDFALSRDGRAAFLYGLSAFALAHLVYILLFLGISGVPLWQAFSEAPLAAAALVLFALSTERWLTPHTGGLRWPVRVYILLITTMGLAALTLPMWVEAMSAPAGQVVLNWPAASVVAGAGLFILSDTILSLRMFRMKEGSRPAATAGMLVWLFYIAGQLLILTGISA